MLSALEGREGIVKLSDAKALIAGSAGYRVHFEKRGDGMLTSDHFPERDEPPIADLVEAWKLAEAFAKVDPERYVNVYVVSGYDWSPVENYVERRLNSYHP